MCSFAFVPFVSIAGQLDPHMVLNKGSTVCILTAGLQVF